MTRVLLGLVAALAAPAPAAASVVTLVDPATALTAQPPLAPGANAVPREDDEPSFRQRVDSREVITTGLDAGGRPVSVTAEQHLRLTGTGDYLYTVPAPVLSVAATPDSQSAPGQRDGAILWAGFSDGTRTLGGRARLDPVPAAVDLPLQIRIRATAGGRAPAPGRRRDGALQLVVTLRNTTATPAPSASARADAGALARALDAARRGVFPHGGVAVAASGRVAARTSRVEAPLAVRGTIAFPGARITTLPGGRLHFDVTLGDGRPLTRTIRVTGHATGLPVPQVRITARTVAPERSLAPPNARSWAAALRRGAAGDSRRMLELAEDGFLREARARQYDTFLANPGPPGATNAATYVYVSAADPPSPRSPDRGLGAVGAALAVVAGLIAAGGAIVAWAHL